uniref:AlNc14C28G2675 protein n=1 Tax=Albugo laibachii Nc14 TaxID=890382 RepID=F0W746_9STRA|nr:AlNc14C28G2675 [Albugo laibachii Nc14]|eukprot:CCA16945.1 AlNc14C28G2675 [Albugo laibachii Nc14]
MTSPIPLLLSKWYGIYRFLHDTRCLRVYQLLIQASKALSRAENPLASMCYRVPNVKIPLQSLISLFPDISKKHIFAAASTLDSNRITLSISS